MGKTVSILLPYPPSLNRYWRHVGNRTILSRGGREYREKVIGIVASLGIGRMEGRLDMTVWLHPPDRRKRDLDNALKGLVDSLEHAGVYEDDAAIDRIEVLRGGVVKGGCAEVHLRVIKKPEGKGNE